MITIPIVLEPAHPTLDDHRPGGLPLFGTALGIGTMVEVAEAAFGGGRVTEIENVRVHTACILKTDAQHTIEARVKAEALDARGRYADVRLVSPGTWGTPEVLHFEARLRWCEVCPSLPRVRPFRLRANAVSADDIYKMFFHGPSFRVVAAAQLSDDGLETQLADGEALANLPLTTRLIEFAMQSAGLLELAVSGRMMVPHAMERVILYPKSRHDDGIYGRTTQIMAPEQNATRASNTSVTCGQSNDLITIEGYQTIALPFSFDQVRGEELACLLREAS